LVAHRLNANARQRLAKLISNPARDHAASRECEVDFVGLLRIPELERASLFEWALLAEGE
jgi:hypothetical protein